jgi:hypothetical protein
MKPPSTRFKKWLVISMVAVGIASFTFDSGLFFYLQVHSPTTPLSATGQIYPLSNHGSIVYITKIQNTLRTALSFIGVLFVFGAGLLNLGWKVFRNSQDDIPKKFY